MLAKMPCKNLSGSQNKNASEENRVNKLAVISRFSRHVNKITKIFRFSRVAKASGRLGIWDVKAREGAARVRDNITRIQPDVVLGADETFVNFHVKDDKVIAPTGAKRVGTAATIDDKVGATVMVTMSQNGNRLLKPFVIFTGAVGGDLMKKYSKYLKSDVLFNPTHWMTTCAYIAYLESIAAQFKGYKVVLVADEAPTHGSKEVMEWVAEFNKTNEFGTTLHLEFIDGGLTSVYQPGDLVANGPIKKHLRASYYNHLGKMVADGDFRAGDRIHITRELLLQWIEEAFKDYNKNSQKNRRIYKAFALCGLNPEEGDVKFEEHLARLSEEGVYKSLLTNTLALNLTNI
jgi:hypothetical protein